MFKTLFKGLSLIGLMFFCLTTVAHAKAKDKVVCSESNLMACDITLTSPPMPLFICGTTSPLTFTLNNGLPVPVPYNFTLTDNGGNTATFTRDPASTCGISTLAPGSCTLILDVTPSCPAGNLNYTLTINTGTTQAPLTAPISSAITTTGPQFTPLAALGAAADCAVLAGTTITNAPGVLVNQFTGGSVCLAPGSAVVGINGTSINPVPGGFGLHINDGTATAAQAALIGTFVFLEAQPCNFNFPTQDITTQTLPGGTYCFSSAANIPGGNTLTLTGSATDVFIFKIPSSLTVNTTANVVMAGGALAGNVYWVVETGSATINGATFVGNVIASTSASFGAGPNPPIFSGRALVQTGQVSFQSNLVIVPGP